MLCATSGGRYISSVNLPLGAYQGTVYGRGLGRQMPKRTPRNGLHQLYEILRFQRQNHRDMEDDEFVSKMFLFFDMNDNQVIEKFEFRNALKLLGILHWHY